MAENHFPSNHPQHEFRRVLRPVAPARRALFQAFLTLLSCCLIAPSTQAEAPPLPVGAAKIDITPDYPIRLSGYGSRRTESEGIEQRLWAKALAFGAGAESAVLLTVDNTGVPSHVTESVYERLHAKTGLTRQNFSIASTHTHTAPMLAGILPNLFSEDIPGDQQGRIDRYTRELIDHLESVALMALENRKSARLSWGEGSVGFARNRRPQGGPVDHSLPLLAARSEAGQLQAVLAQYACHCTTLGGDFNKHCGDWAGYAQEYIEKDHPGTIALIAIGCGADINPHPRHGLNLAQAHGRAVATEISRLLETELHSVSQTPAGRIKRIDLPFDTLPTLEEWTARAVQPGITGYHARKNLERLNRGESLPDKLPYLIQTWSFGPDLAMVFLPGEVVIDYAVRLKKEFDRIWINAYANDVPCYIPSKRILEEGGYEGAGAMLYYDQPTRLGPNTEELIIETIRELVPRTFAVAGGYPNSPPPLSPAESLAHLRIPPEFTLELVASEPLVIDPVAIDFGPDGKLWVVEMADYPQGADGAWTPGGRVKFLEDTNSDGRYDRAALFLEGLPFPTGIMSWRKGALVCAAPDILYAEDTTGDGRADHVEILFSGFATENYQARVNGLSYGLDNWIYGANGLLGGLILSHKSGAQLDIRGRDFRMHPDSGAFEPASGLTQQGRVRDDWGNWFGSDNSSLLWHYPIPHHYLQRNPHLPGPGRRVYVPRGPEANRLYPASRTLERFNDPHHANRVTSACGEGIYRDDLLGADYAGNAFIPEPVHNLVHRLKLQPAGITFAGHRAPEEASSEFLASTDNWFRPVQVRTAPDGALWVVDMYRFVIEHPRWIPEETLATLDVRAGADRGRIYRIVPRDKPLRATRDLTRLPTAELAAELGTRNGPQRDLAHIALVQRQDRTAVEPVKKLALTSELPEVRVQALGVLDGLKALDVSLIEQALEDPHPAVRRHAIRLSEQFDAPALQRKVLAGLGDPDPFVRSQLAFTLGQWSHESAGVALGQLAAQDLEDPWMRTAILSSASRHAAAMLPRVLASDPDRPGHGEMIAGLIATAAAPGNDPQVRARLLISLAPVAGRPIAPWQLRAAAGLIDSFERHGSHWPDLELQSSPETQRAIENFQLIFQHARAVAQNPEEQLELREVAIALLGRGSASWNEELKLLATLATGAPSRLQTAALQALGRHQNPQVADLLLHNWKEHTPSIRGPILETLSARESWLEAILNALNLGTISVAELSPAQRARLREHPQEALRQKAAALLQVQAPANRAEILAAYKHVPQLEGDPARGAAIFESQCAACHQFRATGHPLGPDLAAFSDKSARDFLVAILDPNAVVEPRFVTYEISTRDGRSLAGIVSNETATSLTLLQAGGLRQEFLRTEILEIRASPLSLMPEGLEESIPPDAMAHLISFLSETALPASNSASKQELPTEAATLAAQILDHSRPAREREQLIEDHPDKSIPILQEMIAGMEPGTPEEYRRIPWLWRLSLQAGRRNDPSELKSMLEISIPQPRERLTDWQAVVLGGGIINGLSGDTWPRERLLQLLEGNEALLQRWQRALDLASYMADNENVPHGTRYDALRMIALQPWEKSQPQLLKYLQRETHAELQQGAVSGLADVNHPEAAQALARHFGGLSGYNRNLALHALMRTPERIGILIAALQTGGIPVRALDASQLHTLKTNPAHREVLDQLKDSPEHSHD
jgi:putative membrane-bound dehydrogenase-like protein